jgi:Type I phosphodiesterase / nucleotide pyrophosphatase
MSVVPTTTAVALPMLATGLPPGQTGMVGYKILDAQQDRIVNMLSGRSDTMTGREWQAAPTLFEMSSVACYAVGAHRHRDSPLSDAVLRGTTYVSAVTVEDRFVEAARLLAQPGKALIYVYVSALDSAAHAHGWQSDQWLSTLEALDETLERFASRLTSGHGAIVTADHGIVDVPSSGHVLFDATSTLVAGVRHVGGEPRCLQLYLSGQATPMDRVELAIRWKRVEGDRAWVATREEAVEAGWFGHDVRADVLSRIGDVIVAAGEPLAYYDGRASNTTPRKMIGQHGSMTQDELVVPLIRFGDFATTAV